MRDYNLLQERNEAITKTFNQEYKAFRDDPHNRFIESKLVIKIAIARTASKYHLQVRTIEGIISK